MVDAVDHRVIAGWWADLLGGASTHDNGCSSVSGVAGEALDDLGFVPVPEPKAVKNRVHRDVIATPGASIDDLVTVGARVLRRPDDEIEWTVLADPEGNEFCALAT